MLQFKLIILIDAIDSNEKKMFLQWLNSDFSASYKEIISLTSYLLKYLDKKEKYFTKEKVFTQLYGKETYNDTRLRKVFSDTYLQLRRFLAYQQYVVKQGIWEEYFFIETLKEKGLYSLATQQLKHFKQKLDNYPYLDTLALYQQFIYEQQKQILLHYKQRDKESNIQAVADAFDSYYIVEKLRILQNVRSHQNVYETTYTTYLEPEILHLASIPPFAATPLVQLYQLGYVCILHFNLEDYEAFKPLFYQHIHQFNAHQLRDFYMMMINFCIKKINEGQKHYYEEGLNWYIQAFDSKAILEYGFLSRFTYRNVIAICLALAKYAQAKQIIENWKNYLEPEYQESLYTFNLCKYHYQLKDYKKAIKILLTNDYDDKLLNLSAKVLLLKIYYEAKDFRSLDTTIESCKVYLKRQKVVGYHRKNYTNFLDILKKLATNMSKKEGQEILKPIVENTNPLTEKQWLLQQIAAL